MTTSATLEFVLVSSDYAMVTAVSRGMKKYGAKVSLSPSADAARESLSRRKIDGVFIDMEVSDALGLIAAIRKGTSNSKAAIFACVRSSKESTVTLSAGANFLLLKPLTEESVALHITIARDLLERERRRYFRHAVSLPVSLRDSDGEQRARMTNLSEGGMAVRTSRPLKYSSVVEFEFELSFGVTVSGKGQVAWTNKEGLAGIFMQMIHGKGRELLEAWLVSREQLAATGVTAESPSS
jgi:response regulator RpfG family c-di-GMP phosphodiesterase